MEKENKNNLIIKIIILIFLLGWYSLFLFQKINLTSTDLGRHLKNGEIFINQFFEFSFQNPVLWENFYSYTHPDFPFLNHHWASGVIFYLIWKIFDFEGLHLFFIFLSLFIFLIFFLLAVKNSSFPTAVLVSLLLIPLIAERKEVRPEVFSYLFSVIFVYLLFLFKEKRISPKILIPILFGLQILWVNLHIYFIFGPLIVFSFILEEFLKERSKEKLKILFLSLILVLFAFIFNPFGFKIFNLFFIFKNYGYLIVENQSIRFLEKLGIVNPNFLLFKIGGIILFVSSILLVLKKSFKIPFPFYFLTYLLAGMSFFMIRNLTLFALFALPTLSFNIEILKKNFEKQLSKIEEIIFTFLVLLILIFNFLTQFNNFSFSRENFGFGLGEGVNQSIEFFKKNNLSGPIFNNYDIGSYLIFHLFPKEKVFVDNRPEAYPSLMFKNIYIPLQENENFWQEKSKEYNFNVIFFYRHDATPWAQPFLIKRLADPEWAPVFVDNYSIIFLKRNEINQEIIKNYEIPKEFFIITKNQ